MYILVIYSIICIYFIIIILNIYVSFYICTLINIHRTYGTRVTATAIYGHTYMHVIHMYEYICCIKLKICI